MNIDELKQDRMKKFDVLLGRKWKIEHELQAVTEELAKLQGGYEALCEVKEVSDDSQ